MKTSFKAILRSDLPTKGIMRRIDIRIYFEGKQYKFSTAKFIEPKFWESEAGNVLCASEKAKLINSFIFKKQSDFLQYILRKEAFDERLNIDEIKDIIAGRPIEDSVKSDSLLIDELLEMYINHLRKTNLRKNTVRKFLSLQNTMNSFFSIHFKKMKPTIGIVDLTFLEDFKEYLITNRGNNETTANKGLRNFRSVWNYAIKHEYPVKNPFVGIKLAADARRDTYLTFSEFDKFKKLELPSTSKGTLLSQRLFVFACQTGLRYSDIMDLKWEHIDKDFEAITKNQIKTGKKVIVALSDEAKKLLMRLSLKKKSESVFQKLSNQYINRNLKEMAEMLGFEKNVTFHVARHTFASHLGMKGAPTKLILNMLGDSDMRLAETYINMNREDTIKEAKKFC